jgi:uncharacterized protein YuzE
MTVAFSLHAETVMKERGIAREAVLATLEQPGWTERDPVRPGLMRSFRPDPGFGGRILRAYSAGRLGRDGRRRSRYNRLLRPQCEVTMTPRIEYDREVDAAYVRLSQNKVDVSEQVSDDLIVDFDDQGRIVGLEILDASRHLAPDTLNAAA